MVVVDEISCYYYANSKGLENYVVENDVTFKIRIYVFDKFY